MTTKPFRESLLSENHETWEAIFSLPFVQEVGAGALDESRFAYFIEQDVLYLDEFARVLAAGAGWADTAETRQMFLEHASTVYAVEQALHSTVGTKLGLDLETVREQEHKPVTAAYTNHLHRAANTGPLGGLVAAVLPCYWVYQRVGERLAASPPGHELYATWIASYASEEFAASVNAQLELIDRLAAQANAAQIEQMKSWFRASLRYEWMFWDQAYQRLRWPVG